VSAVFVTGASGFIGGAITRDLARDHTVWALSRREASDAGIRALGAEPVRGSLENLAPGDLPDCDAVVHCAAHVAPWGTREEVFRINVGGTERVLAAARGAGARRFVQMSTEAVLWRGQHLRDVDETCPYPARTPFLYSESKAQAERRVLAANAPGFATLALRPRFVWGPGDTTLVPELRAMAERGAFAWIGGGQATTSTTHIANLVHGTRLALEKGRGGEAYFLTDGEPIRFRELLPRLAEANGFTLAGPSIPAPLARGAAFALETLWRAVGARSAPPLTRHAVALMCCDCTLDDRKAQRELGYAPVITLSEGLAALGSEAASG